MSPAAENAVMPIPKSAGVLGMARTMRLWFSVDFIFSIEIPAIMLKINWLG